MCHDILKFADIRFLAIGSYRIIALCKLFQNISKILNNLVQCSDRHSETVRQLSQLIIRAVLHFYIQISFGDLFRYFCQLRHRLHHRIHDLLAVPLDQSRIIDCRNKKYNKNQNRVSE